MSGYKRLMILGAEDLGNLDVFGVTGVVALGVPGVTYFGVPGKVSIWVSSKVVF